MKLKGSQLSLRTDDIVVTAAVLCYPVDSMSAKEYKQGVIHWTPLDTRNATDLHE